MTTVHKRLVNCYTQYLGGSDYKYYKIVDEQDLLEVVKDERTGLETVERVNKDRVGPIKVEEITLEEFDRIRRGE